MISRALSKDGWTVIPRVGPDGLAAVIASLEATVLLTTDVVVREGGAMVTSDEALGYHTDHHRADLIAWLCLRQTSEGGTTLLADGAAAWTSLSEDQRTRLAEIRLYEHKVFPGDDGEHPLIETKGGQPAFYYARWLVDPGIGTHERQAIDAFDLAIRAHRVAALRLTPGDLLLVDNRRILHGRTAITGSRDRHLLRSWLAVPPRPRDGDAGGGDRCADPDHVPVGESLSRLDAASRRLNHHCLGRQPELEEQGNE